MLAKASEALEKALAFSHSKSVSSRSVAVHLRPSAKTSSRLLTLHAKQGALITLL